MGKSSITSQLSLSLSLAGYSVGILDVDLTGPSIPRLFGHEAAKITQAPGGWLPVQVHPSQVLPPVPPTHKGAESNGTLSSENEAQAGEISDGDTNGTHIIQGSSSIDNTEPIGALYLMSLGFLLPSRSSAVVWRGPKKTAMVRQFLTDVLWPPNLDYLLIDTPPGTSDEHISLAETLLKVTSPPSLATSQDGAGSTRTQPHLVGSVVVTTPQAVATSDVRKELNFCAKVGIKVLGIVENMSGYVCECCGVSTNLFGKGGGQIMSQDFGVRFLGGVPVDRQWGVLVEEGRRPEYGGVVKDSVGGDEDANDESDEEEYDSPPPYGKGVDDGLLVDKYRSSSLSQVFAGITKELLGIIEAGA